MNDSGRQSAHVMWFDVGRDPNLRAGVPPDVTYCHLILVEFSQSEPSVAKDVKGKRPPTSPIRLAAPVVRSIR